jgi:ketosteroid isomerase-like protein
MKVFDAALKCAAIAAFLLFAALPARADPNTDAASALNSWWGALVAGTPEAIGPVLAPEFQMMRADGSGYDKAGYLASDLPKVVAIPSFREMNITEQADHVIVRYFVTVNETRDGKAVQAYAPRLTVFRKEGDRWLVVSHANFAALEN